MRDGGAKANLLIDSLSSDSDNGIPDLELVPPNRNKKKQQRFKKMTSKLNLPKVSVSSENVLPRMYTWCLSLLLCSLVVGLGISSWFSVSLHHSMQDYMKNTTAAIALLQTRVKLLESTQQQLPSTAIPPAVSVPDTRESSKLIDLQKSDNQLQSDVAKLQTAVVELKANFKQLKDNFSSLVVREKALQSTIDQISDQLNTTVISSIQYLLDCLNPTNGDSCSANGTRRDELITKLSSLSDSGHRPTTSVVESSTATAPERRRTINTPTSPHSRP